MELEKKELLIYNKGKTITHQFFVDEDFNVPDMKRDVKRTVMSKGEIQTDTIRYTENYIVITGKILFKILYVTDEGETKIQSLEGKIPFEEKVYTEESPGRNLFVKRTETELNVQVIHSRKLNMKAVTDLEICSDGESTVEILSDAEADVPMYKKFEEKQILCLNTIKQDSYRIKEEITIGGTGETIGEILWCDVMNRRLDTRIGEDEMMFQGELMVFCFYESVDGKYDWTTQLVPYQGKINCYRAKESMYHQVFPQITEIFTETRMDEDGEMRVLGIEATLEMRIIIYEENNVKILDDMYSLEQTCEIMREEKQMERLVMQNHSRCKVVERLSLPEIKDDILQICHSSGKIQIENAIVEEKGLQIEGILHISFLYVKPDDVVPFDVWQGMIPFSCTMDCNEVCDEMTYDLYGNVEQLSISLLGSDEVEVKAAVSVESFMKKTIEIQNIENVLLRPVDKKERENMPGIIGYIAKEGDKLWNLAKKYNTTVENIIKINNLEKMELENGQKMLIFKGNMGIL